MDPIDGPRPGVSNAGSVVRPNTFTGDTVYVGPNLYIQIAPKIFATFAWNTQVAGHEVGVGNLDLADFSRNRFKVKTSFEF